MKNLLTIFLWLITSCPLWGQALPPNREGTSYAEFHNVVKANKPVQYISTGLFRDEGSDGFLVFEGTVAPQYTIYRGRDASQDWKKRGLIAFVPVIQLRMFNAESLPVRPPNFNPYLNFYYLLSKTGDTDAKAFTYLEVQAAHLSNGQSGNFFNPDMTINIEDGNFSTNYHQWGLTRSQYLGASPSALLDSALVSMSFYYRNDWEIDNSPFEIEDGLKGRYALQRFSLVTQLRTKNLNQGSYRYNGQKAYRQFSYLFRLTQTYRVGDVSEIDGQSRRYSVDLFVGMYPANWRMFGLMLHFYHGRDYYNLRFDRRVSLLQAGFLVDFDKFRPRNYRVVE